MSSIRKLSIRGIRNFDDEHQGPFINFSRPLTLILGPNGTGKTTIIECLRFALSGEFPPGSDHGKSFIHDPMLKQLAAISVRGNVKVEISDCRGERVTVARTIEAHRVNKTVKFKTLDNTVTRIDKKTGEKTSLGQHCAAVDVEVMTSMGVSKAILNYVLFCHQDDANWPFETGKKLKERFDEIFETSRYNKALDCIRKIIKDKQTVLKGLIAEQRGLLIVVDEVKSKKKKLKHFEVRRNEAHEKIQDLTNKLKPVNKRLLEIQEIEKEYSRWQIEEEKKKTEYKLLCQQAKALKGEIKEFYIGETRELSNEIICYQEKVNEKNVEVKELEAYVAEKLRFETNMGKQITDRKVKVGTLSQQIKDHKARVAQRDDALRDMNSAWQLNEAIEPEISDEYAVSLLNKFEQRLRQLEEDFKERGLKQDHEQENLQQKVNSWRAEKSTTESQLANTKKELQSTKAEIRTNCALLKQSSAMEQKLNDVDAKLDEANKKVDQLNKSFDIESLKRKIEEATIEEEKNERKCNLVDKEINLLHEQGSLQMKLESSHKELMDKEKEVEVLRKKHEDTLHMLLGKKELPEGNMLESINEIQQVLTERIRNVRKEIETVTYEVMKLETSVKHKTEELEKKQTEVERDKEKISLQCGEYENYREVLLLHSKKVKDIEDKRGMYAYQGAAYKEYIKTLTKPDSCCPLCHRGFQSTNDVTNLVTELRSDMTGHPERLKNCEKELASQRKKYDALLQLHPIVDKIEHFEQVEMTKMRQDIEEISKRLSVARQKAKRLQESMVEPERKLSDCKDMIGDMALWDRYSNDIEDINISVIELQDRLRVAGLTTDKTIQEAQTENKNLQEMLRNTRREIKHLQSTLDLQNEELRRSTASRTKLLEQQLRLHKEMREIKQAKELLQGLQLKEKSLTESIENFEKLLINVDAQCETANNNLQTLKLDIRTIQDRDRNAIRERSKELDKVNSIQAELNAFLSMNIHQQLNDMENQLASYEKQIVKFRNERTTGETKMAKLKEDIAFHDSKRRDLMDNFEMRRKEIDADNLKMSCDMLQTKLAGINYASAAKERETLVERRDSTERERNIAQGNLEELERNVEQLTQELEKKEYRLAHEYYKDKCVELSLTRQCVQDLQNYNKVLDTAMIEYHEERMNTVNKIMKKLWGLIYTGVDTTSIQIRTEATTNTTDKRRQFNYKLVQVKHGIEMDMKGRCSAGQKVLASIILRLALAETFCEKCGVLALDEPTTNLDEENSKSLADALHSYVKMRSRFQKNFQLIVITHDENFIPKLGQLSSNNSYYELFRFENGLSGIKCVSLDGPAGGSRPTCYSSDDDGDAGSTVFADEPIPRQRPRKKRLFEN